MRFSPFVAKPPIHDMDTVKQEAEKLREILAQDLRGRKFFNKLEIEQKRLKRVREEEQREAEAKALRKKQLLEQKRNSTVNKSDIQCLKIKPEEYASSSSSASLPREEVLRRLRFLKQPVTLFGEVEAARLDRLNFVLKAGLFEIDDSDMTEGQTNDFLRSILELKKRQSGMTLSEIKKRKTTTDQDKDDDEDLKRMKTNFEELCDEDKILVFFKRLMNEWNEEIDDNITSPNQADQNQRVATCMECARDLNPLFELCRKKLLAEDIRQALIMIVECCRKREYSAAMDRYIQISIGNAPWPIGVTMVGIHERSAREKIHTNNVSAAHIMNNETTRKYLYSVKRLVTFCQRRYPTVPSKSVEFNSLANGSDLHSLRAAQEARLSISCCMKEII
ncbi:uncharacterized protein LOC142164932 [Nicotiana tabacum]|uniref:Uncharacterized protein LOC142164932 n=3 Tax=Nicotiana TaxID=4085 RepID=A0AC58S3Z1_TOBAC|nr:PREDICTED: pre-mRNA-splicing factor 18-like [Nicotiana sylvestris]XP_016500872.1 PREDICTED: pre-mRNA-splicing factor 18-like [Nicotiana tabacum]